MSYLVVLPNKSFGIATGDGAYCTLQEALKNNKEEASALLKAGDVAEATFYNGKCYIGEPTYRFIVDTGNLYPDKYEIEATIESIEKLGCVFLERNFGSYTAATHSKELFDEVCKANSYWKITSLERPKPEEAVLDEEAIKNSEPILDLDKLMEEAAEQLAEKPEPVIEVKEPEPAIEVEEPKTEPASLMSGWTTQEEFVERPVDVIPDYDKRTAEYQRSLIPDCCLGELYAITDDYLELDDITSTGYCIEHNWQKCGSYWAIDCLPLYKRFVYNEDLSYKRAININYCMDVLPRWLKEIGTAHG